MAISTTCRRFAEILGGTPSVSNGVCVSTRLRTFTARILGRRSRSPLVLPQLFSFESADSQGRTLNLGETVILQREINRFISVLRQQNIIVTALHNHWLFDTPRLMYIHFESVEPPLVFARKVAKALATLDC
ncbi:MAG: DUF1259 domain-containing protein [Chloroflexota bacterium]